MSSRRPRASGWHSYSWGLSPGLAFLFLMLTYAQHPWDPWGQDVSEKKAVGAAQTCSAGAGGVRPYEGSGAHGRCQPQAKCRTGRWTDVVSKRMLFQAEAPVWAKGWSLDSAARCRGCGRQGPHRAGTWESWRSKAFPGQWGPWNPGTDTIMSGERGRKL